MTAKKTGPQGRNAAQYTVIKVRLHPTAEQAVLMEKTFGCCRYLWNRMLSDVQEFYAATDLQYMPPPPPPKKEAPGHNEVVSPALCAVHQNLRKAFLDFFRAPNSFGYPRFKTKKARKDSFTVYCREYRTGPSISLTGSGIQMPKLGLVRATVHRKPLHWWPLVSVTISKARSGKYFCAVVFKCGTQRPEQVLPAGDTTLGLNYSLSRFYVDSGGHSPDLPATAKAREKLARIQRKLSRMEPGSRNHEEQLQKLRLQHEHIVNQRKDFVHKESRRIANAWDAVCVRETDLVELSQTLRQGGVMDLGFGMFRDCLRYKLERQGKRYIVVDHRAPTAKTCHECGCVNEQLSSREKRWTCPHCGAPVIRDVNAAKNLRDMGLGQLLNQETSAA